MCEFCKHKKGLGYKIETETGEWVIGKFYNKSGMYYKHKNCKNHCGVSINFCPMCGGDLREV